MTRYPDPERSDRPGNRAPFFLAPLVAVILLGLMGQVRAQETAPDTPSAVPVEQVAPRPEALESPDVPVVAPTVGPQLDAPAGQPEIQPPSTGLPATEIAPLPETQLAPAPSLLEDPAGAISQMLAPRERRLDLPHDLSPIGMFLAADIVVKTVMLGLAFASLVTWTVWLAKSLELMGARCRLRHALRIITGAETLAEAGERLAGRKGPATGFLAAAQRELRRSAGAIDHAGGQGLLSRLSSELGRIEVEAGRRINAGTGILATIGSTAPFVGLFGTVWGIMNSFIGISKAQTTNLAVVAPGIAEALLATAIGLVAAIPAVVIYNLFARSITTYRQLLTDAATGVERLVSRDLDYRHVPAADGSAPRPTAPVIARAAE